MLKFAGSSAGSMARPVSTPVSILGDIRLQPVGFPSFRLTVQAYLRRYFEGVAQRLRSGTLEAPDGWLYLFPTVSLFTKTHTHYTFELFGARRRYADLRSKVHNALSFNDLLGDFEYDGPTAYTLSFEASESRAAPRVFSHLALAAQRTLSALDSRFPGVADLYPTKLIRVVEDEVECIKSVDGSGLNGVLLIDDCLITNSLGPLVRARYTNLFFAIPADVGHQELSEALNQLIAAGSSQPPGVLLVRQGHQESVAQAGQFANLYLQGAKETTLTQFLEDHSDIIRRALRASNIFFQPDLLWYEGNSDPDEEAIQPDIILRRQDGTWLIIDFKLPLLHKGSITTGGHRRRRFTYTTADGVAQLHNYREFFEYEANRSSAVAKLSGEVRDPQLMLVVGTSENINLTEVNEAMRALKPIDIVDYDTLIRLAIVNWNS